MTLPTAERIDQSARAILSFEPGRGQTAATRARLMLEVRHRAAAPSRSRTRLYATACAAAVVALLVAWGLWRASDSVGPNYRGAIEASDGAVYRRGGSPGREVVHLTEGVMRFKVHPLGVDEFFKVVVGEHRVEVRGTVFHVAAIGGRLVSVSVARGRVEVHDSRTLLADLSVGQHWPTRVSPPNQPVVPSTKPGRVDEAPPVDLAAPGTGTRAPNAPATRGSSTARAATPKPAAPHPSPLRVPARVPPAAPAKPLGPPSPNAIVGVELPGELDFRDGWLAFDRSDYGRAVVLLSRSCRVAAADLAQDACFWHAIALQRAGHEHGARSALRSYLRRWPGATRSNDVRVVLGWVLLRAGDHDGAASLFRAASKDSSKATRQSAGRGLRAIEKKR